MMERNRDKQMWLAAKTYPWKENDGTTRHIEVPTVIAVTEHSEKFHRPYCMYVRKEEKHRQKLLQP